MGDAGNLLAAEALAADVLKETLEQSRGHRVRQARSFRGYIGKETIVQSRNDDAVLAGVGEVEFQVTEAARCEVRFDEDEADLQRESRQHWFAQGPEARVERDSVVFAAEMSHRFHGGPPGAGAFAIEDQLEAADQPRVGANRTVAGMRGKNSGGQVALELPIREQRIEAKREQCVVRREHGYFFHGILLKIEPAVGAGGGGAAGRAGLLDVASAGDGAAAGVPLMLFAATASATSRANSWARW
jgi:hypothetical protein